MGRRALRKTGPTLDLSAYYFEADQLPPHFSPVTIFPRGVPLQVEVGSGKGLFIATESQAHPEQNYIGLEVARTYARHCAARLARLESGNARMVHGDAEHFFREFLPDESVAAVHVYFPDPWWKKRHHKRRIMNERFLRDVARVLIPRGRLHFWTDVQAYFDRSLELIAEKISLDGPFEVPQRSAEGSLDYRTHFERRTRLNREPVYRAEFVKPGASSPGASTKDDGQDRTACPTS